MVKSYKLKQIEITTCSGCEFNYDYVECLLDKTGEEISHNELAEDEIPKNCPLRMGGVLVKLKENESCFILNNADIIIEQEIEK